MTRKKLSPAVNVIPVWSDVPMYEDWILALGREDDDESYGAYMEAFGDEIDAIENDSGAQFGIMMDSFQTAIRIKNDD